MQKEMVKFRGQLLELGNWHLISSARVFLEVILSSQQVINYIGQAIPYALDIIVPSLAGYPDKLKVNLEHIAFNPVKKKALHQFLDEQIHWGTKTLEMKF